MSKILKSYLSPCPYCLWCLAFISMFLRFMWSNQSHKKTENRYRNMVSIIDHGTGSWIFQYYSSVLEFYIKTSSHHATQNFTNAKAYRSQTWKKQLHSCKHHNDNPELETKWWKLWVNSETKGQTNLRNCKRGAPLFFQDVKTNASIAIDIGVKHFGPKSNLNNNTRLSNLTVVLYS